jgi:hypothetical protein
MTYVCESNAENSDRVRERHILLKRLPCHQATNSFADDPITRSRQTFVKLFVLYPVIRNSNTMDQWNFGRFDPFSPSQRHCTSVEPRNWFISANLP